MAKSCFVTKNSNLICVAEIGASRIFESSTVSHQDETKKNIRQERGKIISLLKTTISLPSQTVVMVLKISRG